MTTKIKLNHMKCIANTNVANRFGGTTHVVTFIDYFYSVYTWVTQSSTATKFEVGKVYDVECETDYKTRYINRVKIIKEFSMHDEPTKSEQDSSAIDAEDVLFGKADYK